MALLGGFVAVAMAMGLLLAGLALPAVGVAGQATNGGIKMFNQMPSTFAMNPLAQQSRILAADGSTIGTPFNENRIVKPLKQIAPVMQDAQVAIEDERFFEHGGVDPQGLLRAIASNSVSGSTQGASTLTQQYVKVALQNQALAEGDSDAAKAAVSRSGMSGYVRKLQELKYAVSLEKKYSKKQILEGYLNLVYFGDQQYGVEAAAQHYFSVPASKLNLPQAALLAGVVNSPGVTDPVNNPKASVARRNLVLQKMYEQGKITREEYVEARDSELKLKTKNISSSCASSRYPYFCYYVYNWLLEQPALGESRKEREAKLKAGGLTVQTSFNPKIAQKMEKDIRAKVPGDNDEGVGAAAVMIEPGTGMVVASAQNTDYSNSGQAGKSAINYTVDSDMNGGGGFQIGSTAKLFTLVRTIEDGAPMTGRINNPYSTAGTFTARQIPGACGVSPAEPWKVNNSAPAPTGMITLADATAKSINTAFAMMAAKAGVCEVHKTMTKWGMHDGYGKPLGKNPSDVILGSSNVAPIHVANAYATVAAGGKYCEPRPVKSIKDGSGKTLKLEKVGCKQLITKDQAAAVGQLLTGALEPGGTAPDSALAGGREAFGKTGTVDGAMQSWFVGSTPEYTTAVWVGHPNDQRPMRNIRLGDRFYSGYIYGGTIAAPLWKLIMDDALKGKPKKPLAKPSEKALKGEQVTVPNVIGQSPATAVEMLKSAGFDARIGNPMPSSMTRGLVGAVQPSQGTKATKGSTVTVYPSSGPAPQPPPPPARPAPAPSTSSAPRPSPSPSTTAAPRPSTTAAPSPSTTAAPRPSTTAAEPPKRSGRPTTPPGQR